MYQIIYTKAAARHAPLLKAAKLERNAKSLIAVLKQNPFQNPPPYEKLIGDLKQAYSRRINSQHRLVYRVYEDEKIVKIISMWSHYE
ncbi:MAG: Txe/YoeB family addiction module toxin [Clostridia bacterium]